MDWNNRYVRIARELGLSVKADEEARNVLENLGPLGSWSMLKRRLAGKVVVVFGCGPSLAEDTGKFKAGEMKNAVTIVADGAAKALLERGIVPDVVVTDLDGDEESLINAGSLGAITIVHAHGDNIEKLKRLVPKLKGGVYGTAQVRTKGRVKNFGGFTDGDRAVYLAEHFKPKAILLAGMDFGRVIGAYSGTYDGKKKPKKLAIGKKLIEELASETKVKMLNLTSGGEDIVGVPRKAWTASAFF